MRSHLSDQRVTVIILPESYTGLVGLFVLLVPPYVLPLRAEHGYRMTQHKRCIPRHVRVVLAVLSDHLIVAAEREPPRDAQVVIVVFASTQRGIEITDGLENSASIHNRRMHGNVGAKQQLSVRLIFSNNSLWLFRKK